MTAPTRPSRRLPRPIFEAIVELEDLVREAAALYDGDDALPYVQACGRTGVQRDHLAQLLLDAGVGAR